MFTDYHLILRAPSTVKQYLKRLNTVSKDLGGRGFFPDDSKRLINRTFRAAARHYKDAPTPDPLSPLRF